MRKTGTLPAQRWRSDASCSSMRRRILSMGRDAAPDATEAIAPESLAAGGAPSAFAPAGGKEEANREAGDADRRAFEEADRDAVEEADRGAFEEAEAPDSAAGDADEAAERGSTTGVS